MRPTSRKAAASSFWRGYAASLRRSWLGGMVPAAMVAATRRMSAQFRKQPRIAGHASPKTTKLYDRTADTVTVDEPERIVI